MAPKNPSARDQGLLAVLLVAAVMAFNYWTVESVTPRDVRLFGGDKQGDYSNLLVDGFLAGHTYLRVEPPPALIHAENPYDPAKRPPGIALADSTLFNGHYYMYFGVAPVVTVFLPWRVVMGHDLPAPYAALFFVNGGFLASALLLWSLRRRYFPESGSVALSVSILALGLACMTYAVLRRTSIWEPSVAAGYFFSSFSLLFLYRGLNGRHSVAWFSLSSLCMGLAVGSRPPLIVGAAAFAAPLAWAFIRFLRKRPNLTGADPNGWPWLISLGAPFGAILTGLFIYNFERFGNPFEFGLHYQLTGTYEAAVRHFSLSYLPFNAYVYYGAPAQWGRYFPFLSNIHIPQPPPGYYTCEYVYGILANVPFAWIALLSPLALLNRSGAEAAALRCTLGAILLFYVSVGTFLLLFVTSTARYMVDFAPSLILIATVGLLAAERAAPPRFFRSAVLTLGSAAAAVSIGVCALLNVQLLDLLRQLNAPLYRSLSHACDTPVAWLERWRGTPAGPLVLNLRFPTGRIGSVEPLVTTGREFSSDFLVARYLDPRHLEIGFMHSGAPVRWSGPIAVDYSAEHGLTVSLGSLYPPRAHPLFDSWSDLAYGAQCRWIDVRLDGKVVMEGPQEFFDASPESLLIGREPTGTFGRVFTGRILSVRRAPFKPISIPSDPSGPVEITFDLPHGYGLRQVPLLTVGSPGQADCLIVRTLSPGRIRFYYDHWGDDVLESADIELADLPSHVAVVSLPSLWNESAHPDPRLKQALYLKLDGKLLAYQQVASYAPKPGSLHFGLNAVRSALCEPAYPWAFRSVVPVQTGPLPAANSVAPWAPPQASAGIQREPAEPAPTEPSGAGPPVALGATARLWLWLWLILVLWVLGRLGGIRWADRTASIAKKAAMPLRRPAGWLLRHKALSAATVGALVLALGGYREWISYRASVGPVHLRVLLPQGYWGRSQTLLATGTSGVGSNSFVTYADRRHIKLAIDIWGAVYQSAPIEVDYRDPQDIIISESGLYPKGHPSLKDISPGLLDSLRNETRIELNGKVVLLESRSAYDSTVYDVTVGQTRLAFSSSQARFSGRIFSSERLPVARDYIVKAGQGVHLRFQLGQPTTHALEPLLSFGKAGELGTLYAEPLNGSRVSLHFRSPDSTHLDWPDLPLSQELLHDIEVVPGYSGIDPHPALLISFDGVRLARAKGFIPFGRCEVSTGYNQAPIAGVSRNFGGPKLDGSLEAAAETLPSDPSQEPLLLVATFPQGKTGADPLLVTGVTGAGDLLYVQYTDSSHVRFGIDHWGVGGSLSGPVPVDYAKLHRIELEMGPLRAPQANPLKAATVRIRMDGICVLDTISGVHPFTAEQMTVAKNTIGGSTCEPQFRGKMYSEQLRGTRAP